MSARHTGNRHRQAPRLARGRAPRRRVEDRLRRFHDRDDGVLSGAVDHQRDRQEHQDAHRALFQSGESRGAGEGAKGHPWRAGSRTPIRRGSIPPRRTPRKPSPERGRAHRGRRRRRPGADGEPNRQTPPGDAAIADRAAGPSQALSDHVGEELFSDPRASLDKIAGAPPPGPRIDPSATLKGYGEVGPSADEAFRDPFRPLGSDQAVNVREVRPRRPAGRGRPRRPTDAGSDAWRARGAGWRDRRQPQPRQRPAPASRRRRNRRRPRPLILPRPDAAEARQTAAANLLADLKKRLGGEGPAIQGPSSTSRRPRRESSSASPTGRISPCSRSAPPSRSRASADDGRRRREPADACRAQSSCAATRTPVPTARRPTTIGGCRRRGRRWPITCSIAADSSEKRFERDRGLSPTIGSRTPRIRSRPKTAGSKFWSARRRHDPSPPRMAPSAALALLAPVGGVRRFRANVADLVDDLQRIQVQIAQGDKPPTRLSSIN